MTEKVSGRELARRFGLSEGAIRKHVASGLYRAGRDGLFDVEACRAALEVSRDPDAHLKGLAGGAVVSKEPRASSPMLESGLAKARTAQAILKAKKDELALARMKGELISKADALRACMAVVTVVNERIDGAAAQIGPRVVGLSAAEAERVAREILNKVRVEIARMGAAIEVITDKPAV